VHLAKEGVIQPFELAIGFLQTRAFSLYLQVPLFALLYPGAKRIVALLQFSHLFCQRVIVLLQPSCLNLHSRVQRVSRGARCRRDSARFKVAQRLVFHAESLFEEFDEPAARANVASNHLAIANVHARGCEQF
jgi:hypothetical protein